MRKHLIEVYGKPGCGLCQAAIDKLDGMELPYIKRNLSEFSDGHEGWRDDDSVTIKAAWAFLDGRLPVILIDRFPYTYPQAMRFLRKREGK